MADYDYRYRVQSAAQAAIDGSGMVLFDMFAVARVTGSGNPFAVIPGYHKSAAISAIDLKVANDMPDATAPQRQAKNLAVKNLLANALGVSGYPVPPTLWDQTTLENYMDANDAATLEADRLNTYVTVTLNVNYPLDLVL